MLHSLSVWNAKRKVKNQEEPGLCQGHMQTTLHGTTQVQGVPDWGAKKAQV
jgi:hypothetical protein